MEGTEVSAEELGSVGLVQTAGPDRGRRREGVVELVARHRRDGRAGLRAAGRSHQVPHDLRTVGGPPGLVALLHHADDDEDQDEDDDDAEGDDEDEDAGGLLRVGWEGVVSLRVAREDS